MRLPWHRYTILTSDQPAFMEVGDVFDTGIGRMIVVKQISKTELQARPYNFIDRIIGYARWWWNDNARSPLVIVEMEGGMYEHVSLWRWIEFIFTNPDDVYYDWYAPRPQSGLRKENAKCLAGVMAWGRGFGYDFIIGRKHKDWGLPWFKAWRGISIGADNGDTVHPGDIL